MPLALIERLHTRHQASRDDSIISVSTVGIASSNHSLTRNSAAAKNLFVASSAGIPRIFGGTNFNLLTEIDFHEGVDNLGYDGYFVGVFARAGRYTVQD